MSDHPSSVSHSLCTSVRPSVHPSIHPSRCPSLCPSLFSVPLYLLPSLLCSFICPSLPLSISLTLPPYLLTSLPPSLRRSMHLYLPPVTPFLPYLLLHSLLTYVSLRLSLRSSLSLCVIEKTLNLLSYRSGTIL